MKLQTQAISKSSSDEHFAGRFQGPKYIELGIKVRAKIWLVQSCALAPGRLSWTAFRDFTLQYTTSGL